MIYNERQAWVRQLPGGCLVTLFDGEGNQEFVRDLDGALELVARWMRHEVTFKELGVR